MKRAFIFANGQMDVPPPILKERDPSDLVIAADGGSHHCRSLGIMPNAIIGDLDSLDPQAVSQYEASGVRIVRYPARKDETDLELALVQAQQHQVTDVFIIGGLGARWDMSFANVLLAAHPKLAGLSIRFVDGTQELSLLRAGRQVEISGRNEASLSLIPMGGDAVGITTRGLEYPLENETLQFGSPRGVSNIVVADHAWISLRMGLLLICISMLGVD